MKEQELKDLLVSLLAYPKENEYLEFKVNQYEKEEIGKRLSALSNGAALVSKEFGYLVFGVENETHHVIGTTFQPTLFKIGNEELEHWLAQRLNPRIDFRLYEFKYDERNIVLFQIPAAKGQPVSFLHNDYIRVGSLTRPLKDFPEKERKLWERPATDFEREPALKNVSSTDVIALLDTQAVFDLLLKMPYPTTQSGVLDRLLDEKLIIRSNGHFHISNLGALLFAKNIGMFETVARKAVRVVQYKGNNKVNTLRDQPGQLGYANGFERLMTYLSGLLPEHELIVSAKRETLRMYPPLALRELIANALIHQDFRERGVGPMIEIFNDRIEISNPGKPMVNPDRFIDGYQSRNEEFAAAMRRMGYCEEKGSGIDKVIFEVEYWQLPAPDFRVNETHTQVILYAHKDLNDMNKSDKVRACYQHCCLMFVSNQRMSNQSLRHRFKIEEQNAALASRIIRDTAEASLIKPEDPENKSRKFIRYIPFWA
ncbi:MAG: ATP-binding protein [Saprospiraceae bacterium]